MPDRRDRLEAALGRKGEETKQKILEQALELFNAKGFERVTVEQITRKAGVAKGSFYTYFQTKSDVIVEEFWQIDAYYDSFASAHLGTFHTAVEKLVAFIRAQMQYIQDEVGYKKLKVLYANQVSASARYQMITNTKRRWHAIVREILQQGQTTREFRTDIPPDELSILVNRCIRGVFLDWCVRDGDFDLIKEGERMVRFMILPALRSPTESTLSPE